MDLLTHYVACLFGSLVQCPDHVGSDGPWSASDVQEQVRASSWSVWRKSCLCDEQESCPSMQQVPWFTFSSKVSSRRSTISRIAVSEENTAARSLMHNHLTLLGPPNVGFEGDIAASETSLLEFAMLLEGANFCTCVQDPTDQILWPGACMLEVGTVTKLTLRRSAVLTSWMQTNGNKMT